MTHSRRNDESQGRSRASEQGGAQQPYFLRVKIAAVTNRWVGAQCHTKSTCPASDIIPDVSDKHSPSDLLKYSASYGTIILI